MTRKPDGRSAGAGSRWMAVSATALLVLAGVPEAVADAPAGAYAGPGIGYSRWCLEGVAAGQVVIDPAKDVVEFAALAPCGLAMDLGPLVQRTFSYSADCEPRSDGVSVFWCVAWFADGGSAVLYLRAPLAAGTAWIVQYVEDSQGPLGYEYLKIFLFTHPT